MIHVDVVVIGAGPAGAAFALNLARLRSVLVIDRRTDPGPRIGESLAPAARRLLTDMGLWDAFLAERHSPCHGSRTLWGGDRVVEADGLRDPDGPGWHLDRVRFESWLRYIARARGAAVISPARMEDLRRQDDGRWSFSVVAEERRQALATRLVVDATGREATVARSFGARRHTRDRLVCGWLTGREHPDRQSGLTHIEAEPDGWWYSAPLPGGRRVVAFHTDSDLPAARVASGGAETLLPRLKGLRLIPGVLADGGFTPETDTAGYCAAHSTVLDPPTGDGWLAVGDAATGFDPLSSQGLLNALYTGLAGAEAADSLLAGDATAPARYRAGIASIEAAYRAHLDAWYGQERRWAKQPFWQRRVGALAPAAAFS